MINLWIQKNIIQEFTNPLSSFYKACARVLSLGVMQCNVASISLCLADGSIHGEKERFGYTELFLIRPIFSYVALMHLIVNKSCVQVGPT